MGAMNLRVASVVALSLGALALACSDDSSTPSSTGTSSTSSSSTSSGGTTSSSSGSTGTTSSTSSSSSSSTSSGSTGDAGATLNGCSTFKDETANSQVAVTWGFGITSDPLRCVKVKVGSTVTFNGDFSFHPIGPKGGDTPTAIVATTAGSTAAFTFPTAGSFGYTCTVHSSMTGVIQVVP